MKYFFIVQGEGMGHLTQSLALRSILERNGHSVASTFIGTNFFRAANPLIKEEKCASFFSPVFLPRLDKKGIALIPTFIVNLLLAPLYIFSICRIACKIRASDADAIVVFYDIIGQLGSLLAFSGKPVYAISHHFFFSHPVFKFPKERKIERTLLLLHSHIASLGAQRKIALSFSDETSIPENKLFVLPPLIRSEILENKEITGDHVLVYSLQKGFLEAVCTLAKRYPKKKFEVFLHSLNNEKKLPDNLSAFLVSKDGFMHSLLTSSMVICTSGFETLTEAIYLNKPLIIVPSRNHFEQYCNSLDAKRIGAASVFDDFNSIELPEAKNNLAFVSFKEWIKKADEMFLFHLSN